MSDVMSVLTDELTAGGHSSDPHMLMAAQHSTFENSLA